MTDILREAGWPIYPVLLLGLSAAAVGIRHALEPQRSLVPLLVGLVAATVIMGGLGTALGVQCSASAIRQIDPTQRWIFVMGLSEALNNLTVALVLALTAALGGAFGSHKLARRLEAIDVRR